MSAWRIRSKLALFLLLLAHFGWQVLHAGAQMSAIPVDDSSTPRNGEVFLVAGPSNATGLASPTQLQQTPLLAPQPSILFYANSTLWTPGSLPDPATWSRLDPPGWGPMRLPTEPEAQPRGVPTQTAGTFGPEFFLGRTYAADKQTSVAIIKSDWPGSNLHTQWNPEATSAPLYFSRVVDNTRRALLDLKVLKIHGHIKAFFRMQGEGDVSQSSETYRTDFDHFIAAVRRSFSRPDLPFIFGQISNQGGEAGDIAADWTPFSVQASTLPPGVRFSAADNTLTFIVPCKAAHQAVRVEFLDAMATPSGPPAGNQTGKE